MISVRCSVLLYPTLRYSVINAPASHSLSSPELSPSCGMKSVEVIQENGQFVTAGVGVFARIFMEYFPQLPVEDEGTLRDPDVRDNFIEAIFINSPLRIEN